MTTNYKAWDIKPLLSAEAHNWEVFIKNIVGYGILAASSHNTQPWKFVADHQLQTLEVYLEKAGILPVSDIHERQAVISCGCAIQNIEVASKASGREPIIEFLPKYSDQYLLARISFKEAQPSDRELFEAIPLRMVNRSKCDPTKTLPHEYIQHLSDCTYGNLELKQVADTFMKNIIGEIQEQAIRFVVGDPSFRKELGEWLLPNSTNSTLGMPGNTFGLRDLEAQKIHNELLIGNLDYDLSSGMAISDRERTRTSAAILVILGNDDRESWVHAGRSLERIALLSESYKISMAISAAIVEVPLLSRIFSVRLQTQLKPLVIVTVGYATESRPHSPREPVSEVLTFINE